jgi:hypothetical protein
VLLTILSLTLLLVINLVTAQIIITQPSPVYNYGDNFDVQIIVKGAVGETQPFSLDLVCEGESKNLMEISQLWLKDGEKTIDYSFLLSKSYLKNMNGDCVISSTYGTEKQQTSKFFVSDNINIITNQVNITVNPGEKIIIEGTAIKENSVNVNGFVDLTLQNTTISNSASVDNGIFSITLEIPSNIKSGKYTAIVYVYEKQNNEITNYGYINSLVTIKQIPKSIDIEINKQEIFPNENITFFTTILDQANDKIEDKVTIKVYDKNNEIIYQRLINSGEEIILTFLNNQSPGDYKIEAKALELSTDKGFNIKNYEKLSIRLDNPILNIKNIGNILFNKSIQIEIGEEARILDINLEIGEEKNFTIYAPKGEYNITITDGYESFIATNVALTGAAISIEEVKQVISWKNYTLVWIFLILILVLFIVVLMKRIRKNSYSQPKINFKERGGVEKIKANETKMSETRKVFPIPEHIDQKFLGIHAIQAQYEVELKGKDENVAVLSIKFDNPEKVSRLNKETFGKIINEIKDSKGAVYQSNTYLLSIYTSVNTRSFENEKIALKTAEKISLIIREHNKKFKEIINAGIGIHSGKMIIRKEDKIKFSPLGNVLTLTKRLSDASLKKEGILLLSEDIFKKMMSILKAERKVIDGIVAYSLEKSVIREDNAKFIQGFMKRNKF